MKVRLQRNPRRPLGKGFPRSVYGSHGLNHALYDGFTLNLGGSEMRGGAYTYREGLQAIIGGGA